MPSTPKKNVKSYSQNAKALLLHSGYLLCLAGMAGIEPARTESKSVVLPLDYIPLYKNKGKTTLCLKHN